MRYRRTLILLAMTVACCIAIFVMAGRQKFEKEYDTRMYDTR